MGHCLLSNVVRQRIATSLGSSSSTAPQVNANTLNLSNLLGADAAPTQLTATGTVQQDGQAFTCQVDATPQAMIDQQHLQHATMS